MKEWFETTFVGTIREFWKRFGNERSKDWNKTRDAFVKENPECIICGKTKSLNVHHIVPFHIDPRLELLFSNLLTMCRTCHFIFGHLKYWRAWNDNIKDDAKIWREKLKNRKTK